MNRIAIAAMLLAGPALAERVTDPATGLSVDPPAGYVAQIAPPRPPNTAVISVRRPDDRDTGCQVAYRPAPENAQFTQEQLNAAVLQPTWCDNATRTLGTIYELDQSGPFRHAGIEGFITEGMVRMRPGIPERARDIRTLFVILETPVARTSLVCVGETADFAARREVFLDIVRSTRPAAPPAAAGKP